MNMGYAPGDMANWSCFGEGSNHEIGLSKGSQVGRVALSVVQLARDMIVKNRESHSYVVRGK
jgi:hypothetical protein